MRILFLLNQNVYPHVVGGMELFNHHLIEELVKKHEIGIASTIPPDQVKGFDKLEWFRIKKKWPSIISAPIQYLFLILKERKKYDIFILPFATYGGWYLWYYYVFFLPISFFLKKRLTIIIHSGAEKKCKPFWLYKNIFKNSTLVGVGNKITEFYMSHYNVNVHYIPSLIPIYKSVHSREDLRLSLNIDVTDKLFLYVGSFRKVKNVDLIISAFEILGKTFLVENRIKLILIGDGETRLQNQRKIVESGLESQVIFLGNESKNIVADYYKLSDALIVASSHESLGQTLIEALFNNLPIIASESVAENAFLNNENALLFMPGNSNELAFKVNYFLKNEHLNKTLVQNGQETYQRHFKYENVIDDYEKLFSNIVKI